MAKQQFESKDLKKSKRARKIALLTLSGAVLLIALITFPSFIKNLLGDFGSEVRRLPEYNTAIILAFVLALEFALLLLIPPWAGYYGWHKGRGGVYRKNAIYADNQGITYYRDILKGVSPSLMSILMDMRIEDSKDVTATLLRLYDKKMMGFEGERIICMDNGVPMSADEKELYDMLKSGGITAQGALAWKKNRLSEAYDNGYIKDDSSSRDRTNQKGCQLGCLGMFVLFGLFIALIIFISGGFQGLEDENSASTKIAELYGIYFEGIITPLLKLEAALTTGETVLSTGEPIASIYNIASDIHELVGILWKSIAFFGFMIILFGYPFYIFLYFCGFDSVKMRTQFTRTEKGNELAEKIAGLKRFINEFSTLSESQKEEILLWNDFLVYAVVLEENSIITNDICSLFRKNLSGLFLAEATRSADFLMHFDVVRDKNNYVKQPWKK